MNLPTPEDVEYEANEVGLAWHGYAEDMLRQFAALLRNPAVAMLLKLQEGGQGTPIMDELQKSWQGRTIGQRLFTATERARSFELCARAIEAATIERCSVVAATPFSGEQDDITMAAKDRVAAAIRALPSMVAQSNAAKQ